MTPEERKLLSDLAEKVAKTPPPTPEPEAEEFIRTRIGNRRDALYIMTQTVIVQGLAIEHAQQEIEQLKARLAQAPQPAPASPGFLPRGSGWQTPQAPPPQYQQPPSFQNPPGMQPGPGFQPGPTPGYGPPPPPPSGPFGGIGGGGMGSFLRTAGYTAAGVAAGALAFEGVRSLFGGVEHMMGIGNEPRYRGGFLDDAPGRETIVNNYYESPQELGGDRDLDIADRIGPDSARAFDDSAQDDSSQDFDSAGDDSSSDDFSDDNSDDQS